MRLKVPAGLDAWQSRKRKAPEPPAGPPEVWERVPWIDKMLEVILSANFGELSISLDPLECLTVARQGLSGD